MPLLEIHIANSARIIEAMKTRSGRITAALYARTQKIMLMVARYVVKEKLTGGHPLRVRTGVLRASVRTLPTEIQENKIVGRVQAAASPAEYGHFHELGVSHNWAVTATRARALSFVMDGRRRFYQSVVHRALPARSFMRSALDESAEEIRDSLQQAIDEELDKP